MKKYDIVIARYNEQLDWLSSIHRMDKNICIYNKGNNDILTDFKCLPNIGGDAHTFITHIVENYNTLPEYIVFLQGNPFKRCKNVIELINGHTDEQFVYLSNHIINTETINGWYEKIIMKEGNKPWFESNKHKFEKCFMLKDLIDDILPNAVPFNIVFGAGQQFITNRNNILNRNKNFYKNILDRFEYDYILPWNIERLWKYILKV